MSDIYTLASSSEEGEIKNKKIPFNKSYLKYCLHPTTHCLLGYNRIPLSINYVYNCSNSRLQKEIKKEFPFIRELEGRIERDRKFFSKNRFKVIGEAEEYIGEDIKVIRSIEFVSNQNNIEEKDVCVGVCVDNEDMCVDNEDMCVDNEDMCVDKGVSIDNSVGIDMGVGMTIDTDTHNNTNNILNNNTISNNTINTNTPINNTVINNCIVTDKLIYLLSNNYAFIFFSYKNNKISFTDVFFSRISFYDYFDLCLTNQWESDKKEFRRYKVTLENKSVDLTVVSNTAYVDDGYTGKRRVYGNTIDKVSNIKLTIKPSLSSVVDKQSITPVENHSPLHMKVNLKEVLDRIFITVVDNEIEGDFVVNKGKIYEINKKGNLIEYQGRNYDDFV